MWGRITEREGWNFISFSTPAIDFFEHEERLRRGTNKSALMSCSCRTVAPRKELFFYCATASSFLLSHHAVPSLPTCSPISHHHRHLSTKTTSKNHKDFSFKSLKSYKIDGSPPNNFKQRAFLLLYFVNRKEENKEKIKSRGLGVVSQVHVAFVRTKE